MLYVMVVSIVAAMLIAGSATLFAQSTSAGAAQTYPTRPVRIVTAEPGGGNDFSARAITQSIGMNLGQPMIVDNRGTGTIPSEAVSKAAPDGYTLLLHGSSIWLTPFLQDNVPYDPVRDFAPVTLATRAPLIAVVHPSLPARSIRELIVLAKSRPGALNYGSSGAASTNRLGVELFKAMAGLNIVRINFRGAGAALNSAIAGEVQMMFASAGGSSPHVRSRRLRALGVTTAEPTALFPDLPTVGAGLPGFEYAQILGIFAPAGTPAAVITRLNQELVTTLRRQDVKERFLAGGVEAAGSTPEQLGATVKSEMAKLGKIIKDLGIRGD